jgi:hypothetical protein
MATITARGREGPAHPHVIRPTMIQREWLKRGLNQSGGKLPLFDREGRLYPERTIRSCIEHGWAEHWFNNPMKPDWTICRLTEAGRRVVSER